MTNNPKLEPVSFLTEEHETLASEVDAFARAEIEPRSAESPDYISQALDFVRRLAQAGLLRHVVPLIHGGLREKLDIRSLCIIRRGLARYSSLADTMFAMQGLGSYPITLAGSEALRQRFLPAVASGKSIATFALTEPNAGSDAAGIQSLAARDGGEYVLNGTKRFISNAGVADFYVVFAKTDAAQGRKGISAFVVEKDRPGFQVVRQIELIAPHPIGELAMENCRIPATNLLGNEGDGYSLLLRTLETFRTTVGAAALGMAERALAEATSYAKSRVQFNKTLAEFQGLRFMLAEMATELEAARLLVFQAAAILDQGEEDQTAPGSSASPSLWKPPSSVMASSMAKLYATETAQRVVDRAVQIHGGLGVMKGTVVERLYREVRALRVYEGTSEIQKEIIAHQLLKS